MTGPIRRFRVWLMWRVAPVDPATVDGVLKNLQENPGDGEYDSAAELRHLLGLRGESYFDADRARRASPCTRRAQDDGGENK